MNTIERKIAKRVIADLLQAGYTISVSDGEEVVLDDSIDAAKIFAALGTTDEDRLLTQAPAGASQPGSSFVWFVYGNGGDDVICDYGVSLEPIMAPISRWIDTLVV